MKELDLVDTLTSGVRRATDILFVQNPKGTSMGLTFGGLLYGLSKLLNPTLKRLDAVDFTQAEPVYFFLTGIFLFNIRNLFKRERFNEDIEQALTLINEYKKNPEIPKWQIKSMYVQLSRKVLENVELNPTTQKAAKSASEPTGKT